MLLVQPDFQNFIGNIPTAAFEPNPMSSSLAEIVDLSSSEVSGPNHLATSFPSDPKASPNTTPDKGYKKDKLFRALGKSCDPSHNPVFWVPAQLHPEIAPNEFNAWIEKRASALNVNEKRATRRKSILSLHSFTSEQLVKDKERQFLKPIPSDSSPNYDTFQHPLSSTLVRRHTYTNNQNQKDLLIKKDKDEFIVVPKADTAGLKRSARAKPRKESTGKMGRKKQLERAATTFLPDTQLAPHRKTVSEPIIESEAEKSGSALLDEINSMLSSKIVDNTGELAPAKQLNVRHASLPESMPSNNRMSLEPALKHKINTVAPNLFEYFDAPIPEFNSPSNSSEPTLVSSPEFLAVSSSEPSLVPSSSPDDPDESSIISISPPVTPEATITSKSDVPVRGSKKPFSWFWGNDEEPDKKTSSKKVTKKKTSESLSPSSSPKILFKRSPPQSRVSLVDADDTPLEISPKPKTKTKEKPKKISLFFLSKDKSKDKSKKSKPSIQVTPDHGDHSVQPSQVPPEELHFPLCDPQDLPPQIEQQLYRLSHQKLANPRRPLGQQVVISNLMLSYLRVVNPNFRAPQARSKAPPSDKKDVPRPRSPHLISKERYKSGRHLPEDSSSDEDDDISFSDSDSDDESISSSFGLRRSR